MGNRTFYIDAYTAEGPVQLFDKVDTCTMNVPIQPLARTAKKNIMAPCSPGVVSSAGEQSPKH